MLLNQSRGRSSLLFSRRMLFSLICLALAGCQGNPSGSEEGGALPGVSLEDSEQDTGTGGNQVVDEVAAPTILPAAGPVTALTEISMITATVDGVIYYTMNGEPPTTSSARYNDADRPVIYEDTVVQAITVRGAVVSPVTTVSYVATPVIDGFDFQLKSGTRWSYHYEYRHTVNYSSFGDSSFTTDKDFEVILGDQVEIEGIPAFEVIVIGEHNGIDWRYLAMNKHRLLGSEDGVTFTVLFDAMLGFWPGRGFFLDFDDAGAMSVASSSGDILTISSGWRIDDDDTTYYPGIGTIYDPDAMTIHSSDEEMYQKGVGPYGYRVSSGVTDSYESTNDTTTVTLTGFDVVGDVAMYSADHVIGAGGMATLDAVGETDHIQVDVGSMAQRYLVYVEFLTEGEGAALSLVDREFDLMYEHVHAAVPSPVSCEVAVTDPVEEKFYVWVSTGAVESAGQYRISVMPLASPVSDESIEIYLPWLTYSIDLGEMAVNTLEAQAIYGYEPTEGFSASQNHFFFAIPTSEGVDPVVATIDQTENYYFDIVDANGPGIPEAFEVYPATSGMSVEVFDRHDAEGQYIFGYGIHSGFLTLNPLPPSSGDSGTVPLG